MKDNIYEKLDYYKKLNLVVISYSLLMLLLFKSLGTLKIDFTWLGMLLEWQASETPLLDDLSWLVTCFLFFTASSGSKIKDYMYKMESHKKNFQVHSNYASNLAFFGCWVYDM